MRDFSYQSLARVQNQANAQKQQDFLNYIQQRQPLNVNRELMGNKPSMSQVVDSVTRQVHRHNEEL